jgi:hypothetical protein
MIPGVALIAELAPLCLAAVFLVGALSKLADPMRSRDAIVAFGVPRAEWPLTGLLIGSYLMGNHTIAERMFRHDPRAMLYAPLHTVIWEDADGSAWFTADQPSTQFASFDNPDITQVGIELDHKLAALLETLAVPVPSKLRE